jgi:hypothetical protein
MSAFTITLHLTKGPPFDLSRRDGHIDLWFKRGSHEFVVSGVDAVNHGSAWKSIWCKANNMLSELSFHREFSSELDPSRYSWKTATAEGERSGVVACDGAMASVRHCLGPQSPLGHIPSMDYWRKAELVRDDFEKFRYFFLAAENATSILLGRAPLRGEGEGKWFCEGVAMAFGDDAQTLVAEANLHTKPGYGTLKEVAEELLYADRRCRLMHSKEWTREGKPQTKLTPFDREALEHVRAALPVVRLVAKRLIAAALMK